MVEASGPNPDLSIIFITSEKSPLWGACFELLIADFEMRIFREIEPDRYIF